MPNLCSKEELNLVNGLSGASWSVMLAFGAALGGFFTAAFGWQAAVLADSLSFIISATIMFSVVLPHRKEKPQTNFSFSRISGWHDLREGFIYIKERPKVIALLMVKSGWALSFWPIVPWSTFAFS